VSSPEQTKWRSRAGFFFAALGSAVGLGNIWRFSYVAGESGGAAFLIVYAVAVVTLSLTLLVGELALGRATRSEPLTALSAVGPSPLLEKTGWLAVAASLGILAYYPVVAGWVANYFWRYLVASGSSPAGDFVAHAQAFDRMIADPAAVLPWHALVLGLTATIVSLGVERGIERACRILMPAFVALLVVLVVHALTLDGAPRAVEFLFSPTWAALLEPHTYLAAVGQAFFSVGLGMGVLITYGGYLGGRESLTLTALGIGLGDAAIALLSGLVIFSAVFSYAVDPAHGPTLAFAVLPSVFAQMPDGRWLAASFFLMLFLAALTTTVALLEVLVAVATTRFGIRRVPAALLAGGIVFVLGVPAALGYGPLSRWLPGVTPPLEGIDRLVSEILLPMSGLLTALAIGWGSVGRIVEAAGLGVRAQALWVWSMRLFLPAAIAAAMAGGLAGR
jgi:NSS family neurotransmitter:Na+ symporter